MISSSLSSYSHSFPSVLILNRRYNMAQLPPKVPSNISPNWPSFGHQRAPSMASFLPVPAPPPPSSGNHPSWVDEFLDFTSARRGAHRRSMSDSVAFLEAPMVSSTNINGGGGMHEFDRLDEDQLISMFPDDVPPSSGTSAAPLSSSTPSSPSDHNSINEDDKPSSEQQLVSELEETQSLCNSEAPQTNQAAQTAAAATTADQAIVDPKRVKRILANRQSAQRSRVRKLQYISELERSVTSLQTEVSALSPRVAFLDHQRSVLTVGNSHLKQRIAALAQDKIFKDGSSSRGTEEGNREIEASVSPAKSKEDAGGDSRGIAGPRQQRARELSK